MLAFTTVCMSSRKASWWNKPICAVGHNYDSNAYSLSKPIKFIESGTLPYFKLSLQSNYCTYDRFGNGLWFKLC